MPRKKEHQIANPHHQHIQVYIHALDSFWLFMTHASAVCAYGNLHVNTKGADIHWDMTLEPMSNLYKSI